MRYAFYLILLLILGFRPANGQINANGFPEAELYTIDEGLSQTRVMETFVDSYGFLWIGTSDGLNRFDGTKFYEYRYQPYDSSGLSNDYIRCIAEDGDKNLWIGTNQGLNCLVRQTGEFITYWHGENIKDQTIRAVFADSEGGIWFKTTGYLHRLDPSTRELKNYKHFFNEENTAFTDADCEIVEDINGLLWFGTRDGLFSFDKLNEEFNHYYHDPLDPLSISDSKVRTILEDRNGELWVGTKNGLNKFDRIHNSFKSFYPEGSFYNPGPVNAINDIVEEEGGTLWLGTDQGIALFHKRETSFDLIPSLYIHNSPLNLSSLGSLFLDHSNILWAGGFQGLFKIDLKREKFHLYNSSVTSVPQLTAEMVSAIYKDPQGIVWVGLWNNGIDLLNRSEGTVINMSKDNPDHRHSLNSNNFRVFYRDREGLLWLGSAEGISVYDSKAETFFTLEEYFNPLPEDVSSGRQIYSIKEDKRGDVWMGTDRGVIRFQRKINTLIEYNRIFNDSLSFSIGPVYSLAVDEEDKVWLGTARRGLIYFDTEEDVFYNYSDHINGEFPWKTLNSIFLDSRKLIWIGTPSGLSRFDMRSNSFIHYTEKDGLPNNYIYSILEDKDSMLWMSTNKGLSRFDPETSEFTNYGVSEGLQSYEFNFGAAYEAPDGEMFFGGIAGLNAFYPLNLPVNPRIPPVYITRFEIIDTDHRDEIYLSPDDPQVTVRFNESFTIDFAALDYTHPEKNNYRYSLTEIGKDENWVSVGSENSLTFSNLSSGEYIFRVIGSNNDRRWNEEGASLKIIVEAPFWRTRMAYFIYFLLALVFVYLIIQYRTQALRRSNKILRERDVAAKEVSKQKELLSRRNKNIEDSLNYAQRIQKAMLTTPRLFESILPHSFILHKPKDIVSGDFYWISEVDNKIFVAAVDCTGHGVPGAFMSLIGFELFRKIINMQKIIEPGSILNAMNSNLEEIFGNVGDLSLKDGMDLAFCVLDKKKMLLEFAGAFNPLYLVRENSLKEIKGDRFSVGADTDPEEPVKKVFKTHRIDILPDDMIYIFTDGFADQFGGPEGKKYKYRRFRHLLLTIHKLPLEKQKQYLEDSIEEWRGPLEQIDDILVIGIKPEFEKP